MCSISYGQVTPLLSKGWEKSSPSKPITIDATTTIESNGHPALPTAWTELRGNIISSMRTGDRPVPPSPGISARPNISSPISFGGFGSSSASSPGSNTSLNLGAGVPSTVPRRLPQGRVERSVRSTTRGATNVLLDRFNGFRNAAAPSIPSPILESPQQYTSFTGTPVFGTGVDPDNMEATVADIIYDSVYGDATDSAPLPAPYPNSSSTI